MRRLVTLLALGTVAMALGVAPAAAQDVIWAGSVYGGYAKMMESDGEPLPVPGGSIGVRGNLFAMIDPVLGVGAELGYHGFGSEDVVIATIPGTLSYSALQATAQAIARGVRGSVRPYGTLGLGLYSVKVKAEAGGLEDSETDSKFGVNLGGGVQFRPSASMIGFGIEARWHTVFDGWVNEDLEDSALDIMTISAGINFN